MNKPLVYIIDDDLELIKIMERRFIKYGCELRSFTDPQELFQAFKKTKPAVLFVDLNLGEGLSGFDLIKKIRDELKVDTPILILSGDKDQKKIAHGLEIGANDYIVKPPLRLDFEEIISQYITVENLPKYNKSEFHSVTPEKSASKLLFKISIEEVHLEGLVLLSDHLIKKGASFHLKGSGLKKITPSSDQIFVTVISSAAKTVDEHKKYQIQVEIDDSQEVALEEVRNFLKDKQLQGLS